MTGTKRRTKPSVLAKAEKTNKSTYIIRRGGRVVDCSGLENRRRVTYREFESLSLRHK